MLFSCPLKAVTMTWPPYISSTWPLTWPRYSCWRRKNGWLSFTTRVTISTLSGRMHSATSVIRGLMESIMHSTPIIMVTLVTICERLWLSVWVMVSTSLVMRLSTSPLGTRSK